MKSLKRFGISNLLKVTLSASMFVLTYWSLSKNAFACDPLAGCYEACAVWAGCEAEVVSCDDVEVSCPDTYYWSMWYMCRDASGC